MNQSDPTQFHPAGADPSTGGGGGEDDASQSMSLLGGVARPDDLPQADENDFADVDQQAPGRSLSRGTLVVILVALSGVAVLYGMRMMQGEVSTGGAQQAEAIIEQTLGKLSNPEAMSEDDPLRGNNIDKLFADTDAIVESLDPNLGQYQVPAQFVKKNPFELPIEKQEAEQADESPTDREREAELARLNNEVERMSLQSVMGSADNPVAVINGDFYQQGQAVGEFEITAINSNTMTVTLSAKGQRFTLGMNN